MKQRKSSFSFQLPFNSPRKLKAKEIKSLERFCEGQWYDGAGSCFSADIADANDGVSPLGHPSKVYISQYKYLK